MELKGYVIGPLFNEAEQKQRKYEAEVLKQKFDGKIDWYCPVNADVNDKSKLPSSIDIFDNDTLKVIQSDYIIADITGNDVGAAMELGVAYGLQYARRVIEEMFADNDKEFLEELYSALDKKGLKRKRICAVCSDIRVGTAHEYAGVTIPVGWNQYVIGGLQTMNAIIADSFDTAALIIENDLRIEDERQSTSDSDLQKEVEVIE